MTQLVAASQDLVSPEALRVIESGELEDARPEEILTWGIKNFHPRLALSASFGAPEGMVLLQMMHDIEASSRVFVIDTGRLPQETHDLIDRVRDRFDKPVEVLFPDAGEVQELVIDQGMNGFYESIDRRKRCCEVRKVMPLRRYLHDFDGYVTGLRRDGDWVAETPHGRVTAAKVILAVNGHLASFAQNANEVLRAVMLAFIALHVLGALYQQFVLKTGIMARMKTPG